MAKALAIVGKTDEMNFVVNVDLLTALTPSVDLAGAMRIGTAAISA